MASINCIFTDVYGFVAGDEVIRAVQAHPAPSYLVVSGEEVVGIMRTADLARLLQS